MCPDTKAGGFAFYIVCNSFKIKKGGIFKNNPSNSTQAEMMCIGNALATLAAQEDIPKCTWLIINTDSRQSIDVIQKQSNPLGQKVFTYWSKVISLTGSQKNEFRHVKAHSKIKDARSKANDWCDQEAKRWMRKQREILSKK